MRRPERLHNGELVKRASVAFLLALLLLTAAAADAGWQHDQASGATARAYGIRVVVPNQPGAETPTVSAPEDSVVFSGTFDYNHIVTTGSANASASAVAGPSANATASAEVSNLNIFGGEITATSVVAQAHAEARAGAAKGDISGSAVTGLVALGAPVTGNALQLGDWGSLTTVAGGASGTPATGYRGSVTAQAAPPEPTVTVPKAPKASGTKSSSRAPEPSPGFPPVRQPPAVTPKLTAGGYVFPVYGPSSFTDTFGAMRGDISSGWHHGDDIFAPLGAPLLAVASGTVFSVGWNKIGGNRLWLRDGQGNLFYYAHLSAFSPLAVNGSKVNAGDVIGFVGNTGDAQGTPFHLHFEVHPVGLLGLGYDGAVNPTSYLLAWKHLQDVSFAGGDAWAPLHSLGNAPKPGAILLAATDISTADGLVPGSLQRAIRPLVVKGDNFSSKKKPK